VARSLFIDGRAEEAPHPAVDGAVVNCLQTDILDFVTLDDVAAIAIVPKVNGVVGHVMYQIVANDVAVAEAKENSGNILVDDSTVVNVIVGDFVEERVLRRFPKLIRDPCCRPFSR